MTNLTTESLPRGDEYRTSIDELRFSDGAKARMAARLAEEARREQATNATAAPTARRRRRLPLAAAAAGIALALGMGGIAYATGSLMSVQRFVAHLFGAEEAKIEVVDKVGHPVDVAQSSGGITVSADAIIGDATNIAVVFSISKDDGTAFEGIEPLENGLLPLGFSDDLHVDFPPLSLLGSSWGASGSSYFYDADPADNAIQLVETRSYSGGNLSLVGRTMTASFSDLMLFGDGEPAVIAPGSWKLSFPLDYEDASVALPAGQGFDLNGCDATIDSLEISPIALHMTYTADKTTYAGGSLEWIDAPSGRMPEENAATADVLLHLPVTLAMADGTTVEVEDLGGGSLDEDGDLVHCEKGIFFDRILDLNEVASVTIGGTTVEL